MMQQPTTALVILISGAGSNMQAVVQAAQQRRWTQRFGAHIAAVVANRPDATGLAWAAAQGLPVAVVDHKAYASRDAFDQALQATVDGFVPAGAQPLLILAGFMRILTPGFVAHYGGRMLNIPPSLLPAFAGLHTHQRAIEAGCQFAGATVHRVTAELDHGEYLAQACVPVLPDDTAATLAARVLSQEHLIYPRAIESVLLADQRSA